MRPHFRHCKLIAASLFIVLLSIFIAEPGHAANDEQYVIILPGPTCSVEVDNIGIKSFRILIPTGQLNEMANSTSVLSVHVCECFLLGGDPQKCALDAVTKAARRVQLTPQDAALLRGRIFVFVDNSADFSRIYSALNAAYPSPTSDVAWRILRDFGTSASNLVTGAAGGGTGGSVQPPSGPPPGGSSPVPASEQQQIKKRSCEVDPNVCIDLKTSQASAEFELKCEGLPSIVFSTDGKAGFHVGPLEVSVTLGGSDKH